MPLLDGLPWDSIPGDRIREISADEKGNLSCMPPKWTAGQISSFVCGRPDWPFLASVYMCVWKEFADAHEDAKDIVKKSCLLAPSASTLVGADASADLVECDLRRLARQLFDEWGIPPHPSMLMKALMERSPKLARRDQEPDRDKRRVRNQQRRITIQQQAGQQQ